jgi:hypothetical protein
VRRSCPRCRGNGTGGHRGARAHAVRYGLTRPTGSQYHARPGGRHHRCTQAKGEAHTTSG